MTSTFSEATKVIDVVVAQSRRILEVYRADPGHVQEHANNERRITQGGYGERQIYELVQNGADENQDLPEGGRVHVLLTETHLYCANTGHPVSPEGADTILRMAVSRKRGGQIGRFGVGVKSVLSVTDAPRFYSTSGSFGFDKAWSAARIREVLPELPDLEQTPVLRMAQPLDSTADRAQDPHLDELLTWASTTVVLPLHEEAHHRLGRDLRNFPAHFMLFSSHVSSVVLEDRREGRLLRRVLRQVTHDAEHQVVEERDGKPVRDERWDVFHLDHQPSEEARKTAGELHERPVIRISWAVPAKGVDSRRKRGNFWAFFPTHYDTTLTGILNAPWKTPEDRQNLTKSDFNAELVHAAAKLIIAALPRLIEADDPGSYLNLLTARGREASQWGDEMLSEQVLRVAAGEPSLPDQRAVLRRPKELRLHPEELREKWLDLWAGHSGRPIVWCHHSVEHRERRSRARDIMEIAGVRPASVTEWLEALVADRTPAASARALRIAADMEAVGSELAAEAISARILLTERGDLVPPARGKVYRRSPVGGHGLQDDLTYVHPDVAADGDARHALETLGVREADAEGRLRAVLDIGFGRYGNAEWQDFWKLTRQAGGGRAVVAIQSKVEDPRRSIRIRTADGAFRPIRDAFLAGPVVPDQQVRDQELLIDPEFHRSDAAVLRELGAVDRPVTDWDPREDAWFEEYLDKVYKAYVQTLPSTARRPNPKTLRVDGANPAGPLHLLPRLSPEGRAAFIKHLPRHGLVQNWTRQVGANRNTEQPVTSPIVWILRQMGLVPTSLGTRKPSACVSPEADVDPRLLPVAEIDLETARALRLTVDLHSVPEALWAELILRVLDSEDAEFVGSAYALLTSFDIDTIPWPEDTLTRCQVGEEWSTRADDEIAVTADPEQYRILQRENVPALLVPSAEDAERLIAEWPLKAPSELLQEELEFVVLGTPTQLTDLYPRLRQGRLPRGTDWQLSHCSHLARVVRTPEGRREEPLTEARDGETLLLCGPDDELEILCAVDRLLDLRLGEAGCQALLRQQEKDREGERFLKVRQEPDPARKLLLALGEERLREELPPGLLLADEELNGEAPSDLRIAQLVIATHGEEVLRQLAPALVKAGFDAPQRWAGGHTARAFVTTYGFPSEWAGDQEASQAPPPFETVSGPRKPLPLHPYQMRLVANMYQHLVQSNEKRAMLQIPTGAGKTRIAVEAAVQAIADGVVTGPILWVAQSAELCEQAIETWKFVWSQAGPDQSLRISRMWGGMGAEPAPGGPQVVVAIDDTLARHLHTEQYAWLRDAYVVVLDEAHFAIPKTYTRILDALGIDQHQTSRHLVGLTATAFRGTSDETRRLASRFGHKRLDHGVFEGDDPYPHLQAIGVLSQVEQRELPGGTYTLTPEQIAEVLNSNSMTLPAAVTARLAQDVTRTKRIIEEIERLPQQWPVLVFATSVEHAQVLSALLNESGITAGSVDATTPTGIRKRRIDAFRRGKIQVLTNYNVLTQGFDAPAVRAVVVARPTFSPNTYVQMIGRGLRGPLNGGKESCLILNVADNIEKFDRKLAYTEFEYLWERNA